MPRDPELFVRLRSLADFVTNLVFEEVSQGEDIPTVTRRTFHRESPTITGTTYREEFLWFGLVRKHDDLIKRQPEYQKLAEYVSQSGFLRAFVRRRFPTAQQPMDSEFISYLFYLAIVEDFLSEVVKLAITSNQPFVSHEEQLRLCEAAEADIHDEPITVCAFAPVYRLMRAQDYTELSPNHRIRRIEDEDKNMWLRCVDVFGVAGGEFPVSDADFAIEVNQVIKHGDRHTLSDEVERILTVLRLFKYGGIAVPAVAYGRVNDWRQDTRWWVDPFGAAQARKTGPGVALDNAECKRLNQFWHWYRDKTNLYSDDRLSTALRRFNRASSDDSPEDRLVDSCVAFDALLNPDDRLELSYRVGLRAAFLLGRDSDEREEISELMKTAYRVRGQVVHGGKEFKTREAVQSLSALLDNVVPFLAELIRGWLSLPPEVKGQKVIDKNIEKNVLSGGQFLRPYLGEWVYDPSARSTHENASSK